jgi:hypothetical protein
MQYLDVTLNDLEQAFELARSKPRHLGSAAEGVVRPPSWPRWGDRFFARYSTCVGDVPPLAAKRHFPTSPRPALQPPHQNSYRSTQAGDALRMGRDWPEMSRNRKSGSQYFAPSVCTSGRTNGNGKRKARTAKTFVIVTLDKSCKASFRQQQLMHGR